MSAAQNESRKRGKKRYVSGGQQGKRWKGCRELEVGMQGILITCNMNERKCTAEAFNLLNEYADQLFGPEKVSPTAIEILFHRWASVGCPTSAGWITQSQIRPGFSRASSKQSR